MKNNALNNVVKAVAAGALLTSATAATAAESDEWNFALAPMFLWGLSIDGESSIEGNAAPLDLDFKDDILENLELVLTFHFEARKDDLSLFLEYNYLNLTPDVDATQGPVSAEVEIDFDALIIEGGAGWAFSESESTRWELIGGLRYIDQEIEVNANVTLPGDLPPGEIKGEGGDDWVHLFGGVRVNQKLSERWSMIARADYGYESTDNNAINFNLIFDYRFRGWGSAFVGYRYQDYEYEGSTFGYDAEQQGPLLGLTLYW